MSGILTYLANDADCIDFGAKSQASFSNLLLLFAPIKSPME